MLVQSRGVEPRPPAFQAGASTGSAGTAFPLRLCPGASGRHAGPVPSLHMGCDPVHIPPCRSRGCARAVVPGHTRSGTEEGHGPRPSVRSIAKQQPASTGAAFAASCEGAIHAAVDAAALREGEGQKRKGPDPFGVRASGERCCGTRLHVSRSRTGEPILVAVHAKLHGAREGGAREQAMPREAAGHGVLGDAGRFHDGFLVLFGACRLASEGATIKSLHKLCKRPHNLFPRRCAK